LLLVAKVRPDYSDLDQVVAEALADAEKLERLSRAALQVVEPLVQAQCWGFAEG